MATYYTRQSLVLALDPSIPTIQIAKFNNALVDLKDLLGERQRLLYERTTHSESYRDSHRQYCSLFYREISTILSKAWDWNHGLALAFRSAQKFESRKLASAIETT